MPKRYMQNDTDQTIFVGSVMIPAGQGREVDEQYLPPTGGDAALPPPDSAGGTTTSELLPANLTDLQALPVRDLVPRLEALNDADLAALAELEQGAATPRTTVLSAISKDRKSNV
jgi:hypothetical protein